MKGVDNEILLFESKLVIFVNGLCRIEVTWNKNKLD